MEHLQSVGVHDLRRTSLHVALTPLPSLATAVRDAAGAARAGTSPGLCEAIRTHLRTQDFETLAPFAVPGPLIIPDALLGLVPPPGESLNAAIERMIATPLDEILGEIAGTGHAAGWRVAERDPSRWLRRYIGALLRAWKAFGPVWTQARAALDAEVERIGMASALGAQVELLDGLLPDASMDETGWHVRCACGSGRTAFPDEGLVLIPLVGARSGRIVATQGSLISTVGYPVRPRAVDADRRPALEALLGVPRARLLRSLTTPTSIGQLAALLRAVPSAATHHVDALEAAGLVERDRRGRSVLVRRTERGAHLVALYEGSSGEPRLLRAI